MAPSLISRINVALRSGWHRHVYGRKNGKGDAGKKFHWNEL